MRIERVAVVGAGTMGHGIAQVAAMSGASVQLTDLDADALDRARSSIERNLDKGIERGKLEADVKRATLERIGTTVELAEAVATADLVVEAVPESVELKRKILAAADAAAPAHALLASNTSSLPIGELASATARPARVLGLHFFNPVHLMPLLEIVRGEATSEECVRAALDFAAALGKEPIVVRDSPGFATSRLGLVLGLEAIRMVEAGVASAEDIDKAMTLGYRHPMGPLRLTDLVGLDVRLAIAEHLHRELGPVFEPPRLLRDKVARGETGKKSGRGFYDWDA